LVLGVVGRDGRMGLLRPPLPVDADFVAAATAGRSPDRRFRFASPCLERGCRQWSDDGCGVIDTALAEPPAIAGSPAALPHCEIRSGCRWFSQRGRAACAVCPLIVTRVGTDG
jgi:hypothetical protein